MFIVLYYREIASRKLCKPRPKSRIRITRRLAHEPIYNVEDEHVTLG